MDVSWNRNIYSHWDLNAEQCWITDLVRIFLFKEGHLTKYRRLGCSWPERETRSQFEFFAEQGIDLLSEELQLAKPKIVITLGSEVAGFLQHVKGQKQRNELIGGDIKEFAINNTHFPVLHLAHPGIVMRPESDRNPWPGLHKQHIVEAQAAIARL